MRHAYRLSRAAEVDLLEIWSYIVEQSESLETADKVIAEIAQTIDSLGDFPNIGRTRDDIGKEYRSVNSGAYVIYYREVRVGVEISHILHGARDPSLVLFD